MSAPRLKPLTPDALDAEQRTLYDATFARVRDGKSTGWALTRDDGSLAGPFDAWLRSPVLGTLLEKIGMALRTGHPGAGGGAGSGHLGGGARLEHRL